MRSTLMAEVSMTVMALIVTITLWGSGCISGAMLWAAETGSSDWPQWRGPTRNGIAPDGPPLADAWPKGGPKLVWKSKPLPGWFNGGSGSVTVTDGKAFVYANWIHFTPTRVITAEYVESWGWAPGMPEDLVKKMEEARSSADRGKAKTPEAIDAYVKRFLDGLATVQAEKFGEAIANRIKRGPGGNTWTWKTMEKLGAAVGKEFKSEEEIRALYKDTNAHHKDTLQKDRYAIIRQAQRYTDTIVCLDASTGKLLWKKEYPGTYGTIFKCKASATPAVSGGRCYAVGSTGLYCLSAKDGAEIWRTPIRFSNSSPLVLGDRVFALASPSDKPNGRMGGALCCYDAVDGKLIWRQKQVSSDWGSSVASWTTGGKTYLVANSSGGTFCLDPAKGTVLWKVRGGGCSSATIVDDVMAVHANGAIRVFRIAPEKAELIWEKKDRGPRIGSPIIYKGCVYKAGKRFGCLDLKTGELKWKEVAATLSSPILSDGKIFSFFKPQGESKFVRRLWIRMLKATPEKFEELGRFNPGGSFCSSPVIAGGRLFLRLHDCVACYDISK